MTYPVILRVCSVCHRIYRMGEWVKVEDIDKKDKMDIGMEYERIKWHHTICGECRETSKIN